MMMVVIVIGNHNHRCGHKHLIMMTVMDNDATCRSKYRAGADQKNQLFHDLV